MAGTRSAEHAANRKAVINYNGTGDHIVDKKSVEKEKNYSRTYGNSVGGATGDGQRKRKKMKGLWVLIFLLAIGGILTCTYFFSKDKSTPQVATEVTVDSTAASRPERVVEPEKRIQQQETKIQQQHSQVQAVEPKPVNEEPTKPVKKVETAPNGEPLLEMPEFPEDGNFTPEWLERKKYWDEQQMRIIEWKEQHGPNSVYIEYKELSLEEFIVFNYRQNRHYRVTEYM